jgi:hypothetical protein
MRLRDSAGPLVEHVPALVLDREAVVLDVPTLVICVGRRCSNHAPRVVWVERLVFE